MSDRSAIIAQIAQIIIEMRSPYIRRIAIDGVDGVGKTTFADALAEALESMGGRIIRATVDGFHNPRAVRYNRGRLSPEGFYRDSYDYQTLKRVLLDPLSPGGSGYYVSRVFDHTSDQPVEAIPQQADSGDTLIFDGIFMQRPELRHYWNLTIFLDVRFENSVARLAKRDGGPSSPAAPLNRRYVEGQALYIQECAPKCRASIVVDNNDVSSPRITRMCLPDESGVRNFRKEHC